MTFALQGNAADSHQFRSFSSVLTIRERQQLCEALSPTECWGDAILQNTASGVLRSDPTAYYCALAVAVRQSWVSSATMDFSSGRLSTRIVHMIVSDRLSGLIGIVVPWFAPEQSISLRHSISQARISQE